MRSPNSRWTLEISAEPTPLSRFREGVSSAGCCGDRRGLQPGEPGHGIETIYGWVMLERTQLSSPLDPPSERGSPSASLDSAGVLGNRRPTSPSACARRVIDGRRRMDQ